jgi:hypothetical protein
MLHATRFSATPTSIELLLSMISASTHLLLRDLGFRLAVKEFIGLVFDFDRRMSYGGPANHVRNRNGTWKD